MMKKEIRFGIVGCGAIAQWHTHAIKASDNAVLAAVMDPNLSTAKKWGEDYKVPFFTDMDSLLKSDIDAISVCTPSGLHATLAMQALKANKHVIVEKPMAITADSLKALLQAEEESKARIFPISQLRTMPDVQKAKQLIDDGILGRIVMADLSMKYYRKPEYYEEKKWRGTWMMDGGGALMNQGIHGLDLMRYLCGEVTDVSAHIGTLFHTIETEDTLAANLRFEHGGLGVMTATTSVYPGFRRRLEICGTEGSLVLEEAQLTQLHTRCGMTVDEVQSQQTSGSSDPSQISFEPHARQYQGIVQAIIKQTEPPLTSQDAAKTVRLVLDLYAAAENME